MSLKSSEAAAMLARPELASHCGLFIWSVLNVILKVSKMSVLFPKGFLVMN